MRSPISTQSHHTSNLNSDPTIAASESLIISITTVAPKPKNKKKNRKQPTYRPIQRPDGVVVEYPRYTHSTCQSPPPTLSTRTFQATPLLMSPSSQPRSREVQIQQAQNADLRAVREFDKEPIRQRERDVHRGPLECGRGGYNGSVTAPQLTPMERFLRDEEPWTTHSPRLCEEGMEEMKSKV